MRNGTWRWRVTDTCVLWFRNGQKLVDKTIEKIRNQQETNGCHKFLSTLLSRQDLSYKDVSIITLSLFSDGLNTVCHTSRPLSFMPSRRPALKTRGRLSYFSTVVDLNLTDSVQFLPRDAMHPRYYSNGPVSVCPSVSVSVCLSQVGVLLKRLNGGSHKQHHTIPQRL